MPDRPLIVTTSWDDGHPADHKIAEILAKHKVAATFYVPRHNQEGREVVPAKDLRAMAKVFEIGGHTLDHVQLTDLNHTESARQIQDCKIWLEDVTGGAVRGFCYPRGRYNHTIKRMTERAGFSFARTTKYFYSDNGGDPYEMPTTIQFFPHTKTTFLKNFLKFRSYGLRAELFSAALATRDLVKRVKIIAAICAEKGSLLHIWGHSWELQEYGLWGEFEDVLKYLSQEFDNVRFMTNGEVYLKYRDLPMSL